MREFYGFDETVREKSKPLFLKFVFQGDPERVPSRSLGDWAMRVNRDLVPQVGWILNHDGYRWRVTGIEQSIARKGSPKQDYLPIVYCELINQV